MLMSTSSKYQKADLSFVENRRPFKRKEGKKIRENSILRKILEIEILAMGKNKSEYKKYSL